MASRAWARPRSCSPRSTPARSAASSPAPLGRPPGRRGDAVGPLALEAGAVVGERGLGLGRARRAAGAEGGGLGVGVGQLGAEAGRLGLEGGDDGLVDEGAALALDPPPALGEHRGQAPGPLPQRLEADERVAEVVAAGVAELGLGRQHARRRARPACARSEVVLGGQLGPGRAAVAEPAPQGGELPAGEEQAQRAELGDEVAVAAGGVGLALERAELAPHLAEQVAEAGEVALGGGEPALGLLLAPAVLQDAGRLLDDEAALLGPGVEHGVDLALADDDVLLAADAGVGQQLLDVEQPARHAVDGVLAVARAEQRAGDRDLGEVDRAAARPSCRW